MSGNTMDHSDAAEFQDGGIKTRGTDSVALTTSHAPHPVLTRLTPTLPHLCFKIQAKEATVMGCCLLGFKSPAPPKKKSATFATGHHENIMKMWRDRRDHHGRGSDGGTHELQPPYSPSHTRVSEAKTKVKDRRSCDLYAIDLMSPRLQVSYIAQHLFHGRLNATKSSLSRHRGPVQYWFFREHRERSQ